VSSGERIDKKQRGRDRSVSSQEKVDVVIYCEVNSNFTLLPLFTPDDLQLYLRKQDFWVISK
jgi:hypothetical protein